MKTETLPISTIRDSRTYTHYKTASTQQSGQFLVTEKSARHSTRPHYFYCPSPDFTSRCADCRADTRGHFNNCLSVGNKQLLCPLMWGGHKRKVGGTSKKFRPSAGIVPPLTNYLTPLPWSRQISRESVQRLASAGRKC